MKKFTALFLVAAGGWAQPAIAPPLVGFVEDATRTLRPVYGLAGNFILGPDVSGKIGDGKIVSAAFSGSFGLLKTESSLAAFDLHGKLLASMDVAAGPALFAFSPGGITALAYIASDNALVEWRGSAFAPVSLTYPPAIEDHVLAISFPTPFETSLIVQRRETVWQMDLCIGTAGTNSHQFPKGAHRLTFSDARAPLGRLGLPRCRPNRGPKNRRLGGPHCRILARQFFTATDESGLGAAFRPR
jgi:hypothetical protein